jgi:hypothetical protein
MVAAEKLKPLLGGLAQPESKGHGPALQIV